MKVSVVQMNSSAVKEDNLQQAEGLVREAVAADAPDLVALPEMFACLSAEPEILQASAEVIGESSTVASFSALAKELQTSIHIGSLIEKRERSVLQHQRGAGCQGRYPCQVSQDAPV